MKNIFAKKNYVKLTENQNLRLNHIEDQLKDLRKKNLSTLSKLKNYSQSLPDIADTIAASIYLYKKGSDDPS